MSILNFGSLNIDYVYDVNHFVSKGETIASDHLAVFPGGKGLNQSLALARAGADVHHAGLVGHDGLFLRDLLANSGIDVRHVHVGKDVRSGTAIIQKDTEGDNCILLYGGANRCIDRGLVDEVLSQHRSDDWLLVQNEISQLPYIVGAAADMGMRIILNPSPADERLLSVDLDLVDCFILNEGEASWLCDGGFGSNGGPENSAEELAANLRLRFPRADIVLTLGESGSLMMTGDDIVRQPAYRVPVVDTTAAGDTFTGYLIAGLMSGASSARSLDNAAKASALAVSRSGASPSIPEREQVESFNDVEVLHSSCRSAINTNAGKRIRVDVQVEANGNS